MLEWAALGSIMFAVLIFSARIMRRGITTLDDDRKGYLERMAAGQRQIEEDSKNISAHEQLVLAQAAMEDLLRLDCDKGDARLECNGNVFTLTGPDSQWTVELVMLERMLSCHKVIHGQPRWLLLGDNVQETHNDIGSLMASLNFHWHGVHHLPAEPDHILRRINGARRTRSFQ